MSTDEKMYGGQGWRAKPLHWPYSWPHQCKHWQLSALGPVHAVGHNIVEKSPQSVNVLLREAVIFGLTASKGITMPIPATNVKMCVCVCTCTCACVCAECPSSREYGQILQLILAHLVFCSLTFIGYSMHLFQSTKCWFRLCAQRSFL